MSTTINATETAFFADDPSRYDPEAVVEFNEDDYGRDDLVADALDGYGFEIREDLGSLDDGREDENDYSHTEGEPDSVEPSRAPVASEELEEYERGDPT